MKAYLFKTERGVKILYITNDFKEAQNGINDCQLFEVDKDFLFRNLLSPEKYELVETFTLQNNANELELRLRILKPDILLADSNLIMDINGCLYIKKNNEGMGFIDIDGFTCFFYLGISKKELNKYFSLFCFIDQVKSIKNSLDLK